LRRTIVKGLRVADSRSFRSSLNRALRNLETSGKIQRADIDVEGVKVRAFRLPDWPKRRREIAFHEAGHAVIAEKLRYRVDFVTIKPHGRNLGHVRHNIEANRCVRSDHRILHSLAGPIAEAERIGRPYNRKKDLRGDDLSNVRFEFVSASKTLDDLEADALQMVRKNWKQIERVAALLIKKGEIVGSEVREAIAG